MGLGENSRVVISDGGDDRIRTCEGLLTLNGLANRRLQPLGHISATMSKSYSKRRGRKVKRPNCLTKNLLEKESLPQIRNLLEMREISSAAKVSGGVKDEVNDEGKKAHRGGHDRAIPTGAEERENRNLE